VTVFFDTSVLVAATLTHSPHHLRSSELYSSAERRRAYCAAHTLAEVYATLTAFPGKHRMDGDQALMVLEEIATKLTAVTLEPAEYLSAITGAVTQQITGGTIYDALIAQCALKAKATIIYTWNVDHFRRLGTEIAKRVRTP
jgi:predicted nucleic acid-binding protein